MNNAPATEWVHDLIRGLRRRWGEVRAAEEQLASFAWTEDATEEGTEGSEGDLRPFVRRVLHTATEGSSFQVLEHLWREGHTTLKGLEAVVGGGRTAVADRIGALQQAGLVGRDLEHGRVGLTLLGESVVRLVEELASAGREREG
ncbi:MAG: hypothetical protein ACE5GJ_08030 [Gemmatimonadota bacterium]